MRNDHFTHWHPSQQVSNACLFISRTDFGLVSETYQRCLFQRRRRGAGAESKACGLLFGSERQLMAGHRYSGSGSDGGPRALLAQSYPHPLSRGASSCCNLHRSARSGVHSCIDASRGAPTTVNNAHWKKKSSKHANWCRLAMAYANGLYLKCTLQIMLSDFNLHFGKSCLF